MKQHNDKSSDDEMLPEYDFSQGIRGTSFEVQINAILRQAM